MQLNNLLDRNDCPAIEIKNIMYDSRDKKPTSIFFCLQGITNDGHSFITQAIDNGAIAIVHSREIRRKKEGIVYIHENDLDNAFANAVNRFFGNPSSKLKLIGITGTNGKTTIGSLIFQLLNFQYKTGYIGTLGTKTPDFQLEPNLTTQDLVTNQQILARMVADRVNFCAFEVSSQGIELGRVNQLSFDCCIFTNLTQDHLDFHLNMESYYQAKKQLFLQLTTNGFSIINIDDPYGLRLSQEISKKNITVSMKLSTADVYIHDVIQDKNETSFSITTEGKSFSFITNLIGQYNVFNLVQAMIVCHEYGLLFDGMIESIKHIDIIEGRIERVENDLDLEIFVDFAHTPDGFEKIMSFAKEIVHENGRIIAVFGAPGKRDKSKRSQMGLVADKYCDLIILTEDDPRDEQVSDISNQIASMIYTHPYVKIDSRVEAIRNAISIAKPNDIVLILGKGPERNMYRHKKEAYDGDLQVIIDCINKRKEEEYE